MDELEGRRRFANRLEAFSDIVFGFALAQCAFALEIPKHLEDLPSKYGDLMIFGITFALVAQFWLMHHRLFEYAFAGRKLDVGLNFGLLAVVALLPYALRLWSTFGAAFAGAIAYAAVLGAGFALLAVLQWRGLHDPPRPLSPQAELSVRRAVWRHGSIGIIFLGSIPLFPSLGFRATLVWALSLPLAMLARVVVRARAVPAGTPAAAVES